MQRCPAKGRECTARQGQQKGKHLYCRFRGRQKDRSAASTTPESGVKVLKFDGRFGSSSATPRSLSAFKPALSSQPAARTLGRGQGSREGMCHLIHKSPHLHTGSISLSKKKNKANSSRAEASHAAPGDSPAFPQAGFPRAVPLRAQRARPAVSNSSWHT